MTCIIVTFTIKQGTLVEKILDKFKIAFEINKNKSKKLHVNFKKIFKNFSYSLKPGGITSSQRFKNDKNPKYYT